MSKSGRNQAVTKEEVYEYLSDSAWHTTKDIATSFMVTKTTITKRLRDLARDEVPLINGNKGYRLVRPEDVTDIDTALDIERMTGWIVGVVNRQALTARPMRGLLEGARALLPQSKEERAVVRKYLVHLTHLIDWSDVEDA